MKLVCVVLVILFACMMALLLPSVRAHADPLPLHGSLAVGGAWAGWPTDRTSQAPTALMVELHLLLKPPALHRASLDLGVRHTFFNSQQNYWRGKCKFAADLNIPLGADLAFFTAYERTYYRGNDYCWSGFRRKF